MLLKVGTRGSRLSLLQTEEVSKRLRRTFRQIDVETVIIETTGDKFPEKPILSIKRKGVFEKEVDKAVLSGRVDFAVHSMKDVPTDLPKGLTIAAVPKRASPLDVLVCKGGGRLQNLPEAGVIGTGSPRRASQLLFIRPDLKIEPVRGNVDTRIRKLDEGKYDALVLAEAGLLRLGLRKRISQRFRLDELTPAPGQGALCIVARRNDKTTLRLLKKIDDSTSRAETEAERSFLRRIGGGCRVPIGVVARSRKRRLVILSSLIHERTNTKILTQAEGNADRAIQIGEKLAEKIMLLSKL